MSEVSRWFLQLFQDVGEYQLAHQHTIQPTDADMKGRLDMVTEVDRESERRIVSALQDKFPRDGIYAEEEARAESQTGRTWIIDPLDGTTNYLHGHPFFGISVGLREGDRLTEGYAYFPRMHKFYEAREGENARKNGQPISVSPIDDPLKSLLATGFHDVEEDKSRYNPPIFNDILPRVQGIRRAGSAVHDACLVAEGVYEGFWEFDLEPWDVAATAVILRSAGGTVTDMWGGEDWYEGQNLLMSNGPLHEPLREWIQPHLPKDGL